MHSDDKIIHVIQTDQPRIERNYPGINWSTICRNISSKRLTSEQRISLYVLVNEKTEHRRLMNIIGTCCTSVDTPPAEINDDTRWVARPTFDDLVRPVLNNVPTLTKYNILKIFIKYISFNVNNRIDVSELDFMLNLED